MNEFINKSELEFRDISSEKWREYVWNDGCKIVIHNPTHLNVSNSGGHRIFDLDGISHYIPSGWRELNWYAKEGEPNFVK